VEHADLHDPSRRHGPDAAAGLPPVVLPVVAIVGRPNVGKSTLFNRLSGTRKALVLDRPGVTRDRNYEIASWLERPYMLVDTGGFEPEPGDALFAAMRRQSEAAVAEADVVVLLVDRQSGLTPPDLQTADLIRTSGKPVIVAVNKCDTPTHDDEAAEFWELGFEELVPVSAEHGRGMYELMEAVLARFPEEAGEEPEADGEIRVSVLGRPNIGKSTLVNRLLGEDRHVVHDAPGTTVDATDSVLEVDGTRFRLIDTAGVRRKARIDDRVEQLAVGAAIRTIDRSHVVMLVIDGAEGPTEQDAHLAALVEERGRAMVVLVNKWDRVREMEDRDVRVVEDEFSRKLPHVVNRPVLYISARTGKGCHGILSVVRDVYASFNQRVPTARLNEFLRDAVAAYSPPQLYHHPVRLNYMTQVRVRPPTFTVFCNSPQGVRGHYDKYLQNRLREQFGFFGSPVRIQYRRKRRPGEALDPERPLNALFRPSEEGFDPHGAQLVVLGGDDDWGDEGVGEADVLYEGGVDLDEE
jgi:GTP-binding protein